MFASTNSRQHPGKEIVNVSAQERMLSLVGGSLLVMYGFLRLPVSAIVALMGGGYLLYRAATGHCYAYEALDINTAVATRGARGVPNEVRGDVVAEASWASFPASDPPAWTMSD